MPSIVVDPADVDVFVHLDSPVRSGRTSRSPQQQQQPCTCTCAVRSRTQTVTLVVRGGRLELMGLGTLHPAAADPSLPAWDTPTLAAAVCARSLALGAATWDRASFQRLSPELADAVAALWALLDAA